MQKIKYNLKRNNNSFRIRGKFVLPRSIVRKGVTTRTGAQKEEDGWAAKLAKYIPGEFVAGYIAIDGLMKAANAGEPPPVPLPFPEIWFWVIFVLFVIGTALYILAMNLRENQKIDYPQMIISPIAFFFWAFGLGGPFVFLKDYNEPMGAVILIIATIFIPIIDAIVTYLLKNKKI
jgi:hypothetical protein